MTLFPVDGPASRQVRSTLPVSEIDAALTAQFIVAWAGEYGEGDRPQRLGWWRTDLVSEDGGHDLFSRLAPQSWRWAAWQAVREAARRRDATQRAKDHDPDRVRTLYSLGFEVDERLDERLQELKRTGALPYEVLPGLTLCEEGWSRARFFAWVDSHGTVKWKSTPVGCEVEGDAAQMTPGQLVQRCVAGLAGAKDGYPLPHVRRRS